jgi:hypothetical protein
MYLVLSAFTSSPISLAAAATKASVQKFILEEKIFQIILFKHSSLISFPQIM